MKTLTKDWLKAALIRAVRTWAQVAATSIPTTAMLLSEVNWGVVLSTATLSAIASLLMSIAGLPEVEAEG
ncbi:MAG: holin [Saccharofermentanales bacterium]|jgi:hypothetical protein|nr:holin [Bacillota bacterium]NLB08441.1 hypothetical protein [Clostridiales bacterium]